MHNLIVIIERELVPLNLFVLFSYNFDNKRFRNLWLGIHFEQLLPLNDFHCANCEEKCAHRKFSLKFPVMAFIFSMKQKAFKSIEICRIISTKKPDNNGWTRVGRVRMGEREKKRKCQVKMIKKMETHHQWNASIDNASSKPCHRISYCKCDPTDNR